jgi:hypothetical protein
LFCHRSFERQGTDRAKALAAGGSVIPMRVA